jgi:predicted ArsR family transcriptional regulator
MARPVQITRQALIPPLMARGPVSAAELGKALRVNRATVVRALRRFEEGELLTLGTHRTARYMLASAE